MSWPSAFFLVVRSLFSVPAVALALAGWGSVGALFAFLALLGPDRLLVGLRVLLLELLERRCLGLGSVASLLPAAPLRLLLDVLLPRPALGGERHPEPVEQREGLLVGLGRRGDRNVEAPHLVDRVGFDLGECGLRANCRCGV